MKPTGKFCSTLKKSIRCLFPVMALVLTTSCSRPDDMTSREEDRILKLVLEFERPDDGYAIVSRLTNYQLADDDIVSENNKKKKLPDRIVVGILRRLNEKNQEPVTIGLKSDQRKGYFIDKRDDYSDSEYRDFWLKIREERPKVRSRTWVSRPVYDRESGIVMVYVQQDRGGGDCYGEMIVYKYEDGRLEELLRALEWIS